MNQQSIPIPPANSALEISRPTRPATAWLILLVGLAAGFMLILYHAVHTPTYTIDSYFYLSKAKQLLAGEGLTTSWNDGIDPKYFPGYSLLLALSFAFGGSHIPAQLIAYVLSVILLIAALKELQVGETEQALAATAFSVNPIVVKWYSLPMAEGAALAVSLAATVLFLRHLRTKKLPYLLLACMLGGFAVIIRIEALFLLLIFIPLLYRERRSVNIAAVAAGTTLLFLPLLAYWAGVSRQAGEGPAYVQEFMRTVAKLDLLRNILYNVWVPFGLMQKTALIEEAAKGTAAAAVICAISCVWILTGLFCFWSGLVWGIMNRLGPAARAAVILFLGYAALHAFWHYRYERFILLILPVAALIWARFLSFLNDRIHQRTGRQLLLSVQALLALSGLALGHVFASAHAGLLQREAHNLNFAVVAQRINALNKNQEPVLTDLGPHLAYYLEAHSYMDDDHGNYWRRAFPPEETAERLDRLGIGLIVTRREFPQWIAEHSIPPGQISDFEVVSGVNEELTVIRRNPSGLSGS